MEKMETAKVIKSFVWKFGERITAQVITLIVSLVLARLLTPNDYGIIAMVMIFISIANVFVSNGFGNALIQKLNADELDFSSVFWVNILLGIIIYVVLFATAPFLAAFYRMPSLTAVIRVLGIRIIVASINSVQQAYVARNMLFKRFFFSTLFGTLISGVVGLMMAYMGFGVWALVAQYLVNTCTDTVVLWITVKWRPIFKCSLARVSSLFSFGWKLLISGLIDTAYLQLRSLIIGKLYSASDLAFYNQGDRIPNLIVVNINSSIQAVLFPAMANNQGNKEKVKSMTRKAIQVSSYLMWPLMIGLAAIAEPLIRLILSEKWLPCVPFIQVLSISYGFWPIHTANLQAINALGRSDLFLRLEIIKKIVGIAIISITLRMGPLVMAYGVVAGGIISMFVNAYPNIKLLRYGFVEQIKDFTPGLCLSSVMYVLIRWVSILQWPDFITIVVEIILGMIIYVVLSFLTHNESFSYMLQIIKGKTLKKPGNQ